MSNLFSSGSRNTNSNLIIFEECMVLEICVKKKMTYVCIIETSKYHLKHKVLKSRNGFTPYPPLYI